jgi:hypothetical protein
MIHISELIPQRIPYQNNCCLELVARFTAKKEVLLPMNSIQQQFEVICRLSEVNKRVQIVLVGRGVRFAQAIDENGLERRPCGIGWLGLEFSAHVLEVLYAEIPLMKIGSFRFDKLRFIQKKLIFFMISEFYFEF